MGKLDICKLNHTLVHCNIQKPRSVYIYIYVYVCVCVCVCVYIHTQKRLFLKVFIWLHGVLAEACAILILACKV